MTQLKQRIQEFYDSSSGLWEQVWGEHMHHGYYQAYETSDKDRRQAQIDLIEELLSWSNCSSVPTAILDAGCGIGGSSLYLIDKFPHSQVIGITLSPVQAQRARERSLELSLSARSQFQVADALDMPFADQSFDLVWSLESGEHMPNKTKFLEECFRVLKPGGTLIFATWCHRDIATKPLTVNEQEHLQRIYDVYCLPYVISLAEYEAIAQSINFQNIRTTDWSTQVAPFWDQVINSAFSLASIFAVLRSGLSTINATLSLRQMSRGYARGLVKFGVLVATKS
jgi:tocopherol O-methyltransferase